MTEFDYLIVGSGLFGAVFAHEAIKKGKKCLVVEKRGHIGGNVYCEHRDGINIHKYGAHIFHTGDREVWDYVRQFTGFNHYINSPVANFNGEIYNLPFNMNTFSKMWGVSTPHEAEEIINSQRAEITAPKNLEEQAISLVGRDVYEKLIKGYTEKQWGRDCTRLPAFIINRLPVRYTYDNNYFNDPYQGIPIGGYNAIIEQLLAGCTVMIGTDFLAHRGLAEKAAKTVYTGAIDAYYEYKFGRLQYRSLRFETERVEAANYQGVAVVNYTDRDTPYTRVIEHKHFEFGNQPVSYVTKEYPSEWKPGDEPYYPINDEENRKLMEKYAALAHDNVIFGGRLAEYRYYDMDKTIRSAIDVARAELE